MRLFIEENTSVFFIFLIVTVLLQQIFWHSPFKPSYLARPIIEEYFLAFLHVEKWVGEVGEPIFDRWVDGHRSDKDFVIDDRYYRSKKKIFNPWIDTIGVSMTNSIDR